MTMAGAELIAYGTEIVSYLRTLKDFTGAYKSLKEFFGETLPDFVSNTLADNQPNDEVWERLTKEINNLPEEKQRLLFKKMGLYTENSASVYNANNNGNGKYNTAINKVEKLEQNFYPPK